MESFALNCKLHRLQQAKKDSKESVVLADFGEIKD